MKTIKLQEQAEKQNKTSSVSKPIDKTEEVIEEEEMPLKIKGKTRGRPKGMGIKETPKQTPGKVAEDSLPDSEVPPASSKKEAVFFK